MCAQILFVYYGYIECCVLKRIFCCLENTSFFFVVCVRLVYKTKTNLEIRQNEVKKPPRTLNNLSIVYKTTLTET